MSTLSLPLLFFSLGCSNKASSHQRYVVNLFAQSVIVPALCSLSFIPYTRQAAQLLLGTALHESGGLKHRKQVKGPALSFFQVEPNTHDDNWKSYLDYRPAAAAEVTALMTSPGADKLHELQFNDRYAAAMARIKYYRSPVKLPKYDDIGKQADCWKKVYNTGGKGTVEKYLNDWNIYGGNSVNFPKSCP